MGRTQRALTSLVAAIPAGVLSYLLVMVFLSKADSLKTITQVLAGTTLLCSGLVTLMPFGLLIFGGKKAAAENEGKAGGKKSDIDEDGEEVEGEEVEAVADLEEVEETEDDDGASAFDVEESDADIMADSDDDISGPASSLDEIESVDFDDEEEEEKPAPKKRKK